MADVQILPATRLRGTTRLPGDKSIAHRALLCGALAKGSTRIAGIPSGVDISATIGAINVCGVQTKRDQEAVIVEGLGDALRCDGATIDCANSGTSMRLLMGVLAGQPGTVRLVGDASLSRRPMRRVAEPLRRMGANITLSDDGVAPVGISGSRTLSGIDYEVPVASAQLKTALLFAGLEANGRTRLRGLLGSRDHAERMLPCFGVSLELRAGEIVLEGRQRLCGTSVEVPGDPSSAAFWIAAALITPSSDIELLDVCLNPTRVGFIDALRLMGASIETRLHRREPEPVGTIHVRSSALKGITLDAADVPSLIDELPLLAVLATQADGVTVVHGAEELRVKESDRIDSIASTLRAMGATIQTFHDGFAIEGPQGLRGTTIDPCGDHRIAMAAAIAALAARGNTCIRDAQCVGVSYPGFFSTLRSLGAEVR